MPKNSAYGFEKPYLEEIEKELTAFSDVIYYDSFSNLIIEKKPNIANEEVKTVMFSFYVSQNSFMVSEIAKNGNAIISSLMGGNDEFNGKKAVTLNGKNGYIKLNDSKLECDFGYSDKKTAEKYIRCGDILSIKHSSESIGDAIFTNAPHTVIKNVFSECIKDYYNKRVIFAFVREQKKGAYALGQNVKCDEAYFICFSDEIKENMSFIKKEGSFVSPAKIEKNAVVLEKDTSFASQYFISSGVKNICGIALKKETIGDGIIKIKKETVNELKAFIKG